MSATSLHCAQLVAKLVRQCSIEHRRVKGYTCQLGPDDWYSWVMKSHTHAYHISFYIIPQQAESEHEIDNFSGHGLIPVAKREMGVHRESLALVSGVEADLDSGCHEKQVNGCIGNLHSSGNSELVSQQYNSGRLSDGVTHKDHKLTDCFRGSDATIHIVSTPYR